MARDMGYPMVQMNMTIHRDDRDALVAKAKEADVKLRELIVQSVLGRPAREAPSRTAYLRARVVELEAEVERLRGA